MNQDSGRTDADAASAVDKSTQTAGQRPPLPSAPTEAHPTQIGPYKILEVLGEGGMGVVYLAEQSKPIHRRVALKIIKLGMDTKQVIARFETEREALALMNHPNVAKVFDAGASETGRPYFAMEYVAGIPITDYCDKHRLNTEERLRLFMDVCHAVQHAHQKGIIHRDIKPSNVLVAVQDDKPVPKVIDFGVAKATQHRLTERTLFTEQGQLIGTPGYMSPEQAEMTALDIDTRTDIYSLGVLLYELLVGALPFDTKTLLCAGFAEVQRIIREVDPPKPSTKLSSLQSEPGAQAPGAISEPGALATGPSKARAKTTSRLDDIARRHRTEPNTLLRQLRGDLDWITMRALEKDRTRRYATASALADDIIRHLNNEPVQAGPPNRLYRLRKFVRRNRVPVIAGCGIVAALLAGLVSTLRQYARTEAARQEAVQGQEYASAMRRAAESRRTEAEAMNRFFDDSFRAIDPSVARGHELTAKELLDQAAAKLTGAFPGQPLSEAGLHSTIGKTYRALGADAAAESHLRKALTLRKQHLGDGHLLVGETLHDLGALMDDQSRYDAAEDFFNDALAVYRKNWGETHLQVLEMRNALGILNLRSGEYDKAEAVFRQVLEELRKLRSPTDSMIADTLSCLAAVLREKGEYEQTESYEREALEMRRNRFGAEHPFVAESLNNLGLVLLYKGDYAAAEEFLREALVMRRKLHGDMHPAVAGVLRNLGETLSQCGRHVEGEQLVRQALSIQKAVAGSDHVDVGFFLSTLGAVLLAKGEPAEAEPMLRESLTILRGKLPAKHWAVAHAESLLGESLALSNRSGDAEKLLVESFTTLKTVRGANDRYTRQALARLIRFYDSTGQDERARAYRSLLP